jgi:hypothetical protein
VGDSGVSGSAWAISAKRFDKVQNYAKLPFAHLLSRLFAEFNGRVAKKVNLA